MHERNRVVGIVRGERERPGEQPEVAHQDGYGREHPRPPVHKGERVFHERDLGLDRRRDRAEHGIAQGEINGRNTEQQPEAAISRECAGA